LKGFTLLEVLLVVAILAILAGIVILALNPGKQLADSRNSQRQVDVNTVLNAVYQYAIDNNGSLPSLITTSPQEICVSGVATSSCGSAIHLFELTAEERYLTAIPRDPQATSTTTTSYTIFRTGNNRVTVSASLAEQGETISVTR
jgi:prepilin-type N-terminal cleavage/methylation domain-containing protein